MAPALRFILPGNVLDLIVYLWPIYLGYVCVVTDQILLNDLTSFI